MAKLPDLKYLECLAWVKAERISELKRKIWMPHTSVDLFLQTWPDASRGLSTDSFSFAGQMLTEEYTSVFELRWTYSDTSEEAWLYCVFFGDELAYCVRNPNAKFFEDLKNRNMVAVAGKDKYFD